MNQIEISWEDGEPPDWINQIETYCTKVLIHLGIENWEISLRFISNQEIKQLNQTYRQKDEPTDILSFCQLEEVPGHEGTGFLKPEHFGIVAASQGMNPEELLIPAGDLVISYTRVTQNAHDFSVPVHEELARVLIHGILHLKGLDHATNEVHEPMLLFQESILSSLSPMEGI